MSYDWPLIFGLAKLAAILCVASYFWRRPQNGIFFIALWWAADAWIGKF